MVDDLIAFYRAQLDEDEQAARDASRKRTRRPHKGSGARWSRYVEGGDDGWAIESEDGEHGFIVGWPEALAVHIARHDPARVLVDLESKRRIVEEHAPEDGHCSTCTIEDVEENAGADYDVEPEMIRVRRPVAWPCPTVRLLAELYADRPGYKEEWRP